MEKPYVELREQLLAESPDLHGALMRSWKIAEAEWLPAVTGNAGSFNAYPHIRNHEKYANEILRQVFELDPSSDVLQMSAAEKYLFLAAMLFHDIGRTQVSKGHALRSQEIISKKFADLGIPNKPLAEVLANICCYHDCTRATESSLNLREHSITPYGVIHAKRLAVLLKFIDNLDGAYTRVLPHYLSGGPDNFIENLRRSTSGVLVDLRNRMAVSTLGIGKEAFKSTKADEDTAGERGNGCVLWADLQTAANDEFAVDLLPVETDEMDAHLRLAFESLSSEKIGKAESLDSALKDAAVGALMASTELTRLEGSSEKEREPFKKMHEAAKSAVTDSNWSELLADVRNGLAMLRLRLTQQTPAPLSKWLRVLGVDEAMHGKRWIPFHCCEWVGSNRADAPNSYLPLPALQQSETATKDIRFCALVPYMILRKLVFPTGLKGMADVSRLLFLALAANVRSSALLLQDMRDTLSTSGVSVDAWLLGHDEHLFTCAGRETHEPSLSKSFLHEVVDGMWHLSAGVFGRETFDYETLAAKLRASDVDRVRTAVRRLGIVTRHRRGETSCYIVGFTGCDWRWMPREAVDKHTCCHFHSQRWVKEQVDRLAEPWDDVALGRKDA